MAKGQKTPKKSKVTASIKLRDSKSYKSSISSKITRTRILGLHRAQRPAYLPPPFVMPYPIQMRNLAGSLPALPHLIRFEKRLRFWPYVVPDSIWIETIKWDNLIPQDASFKGSAGGGASIYVQPHGPIFINYRLWRGLTTFGEGILIARVGDGVIAPAHKNINLAANIFSETFGVFELGGWPDPFPAILYGYHQVILDLWVVSENGQPLPSEYQTNPPDTRKFALESTDWAWLYVAPGCRDLSVIGGLDWCTLKSFSVTPTTIMLDPTGMKVGLNQSVTVKWQFDTAGLQATQYGYPGSFGGVRLYVFLVGNAFGSNVVVLDLPQAQENGQRVIDLSGLAFQSPASIMITSSKALGCSSPSQSVAITGIKPNTPAPLPGPADIVPIAHWYEPSLVNQGQRFIVYFRCQNIGGKATGPFVARMELDNGVSVEVNVASMVPGEATNIYWTFDDGLFGFEHWIYCYFDSKNAVTESNKGNNVDYQNIILY